MNEGVVLTEEEMYSRSQKNIERWIAVHMIPVRQSLPIYRSLVKIQAFPYAWTPDLSDRF